MSAPAPVAVVGAGPAGLAAARALAARALAGRGVAFEVLERHDDVGGIWDLSNPGTPMYASAHFISSKGVSGFSGFPMPDAYPDYPDRRLILAYLRAFADRYDLRRHVRFGTEVVRAEQAAGGKWTVTAGDGSERRYSALVCANGVTWTPNIPDLPGTFAGEVSHANTYRSTDEFRGRRVLVVGGGNSGVEIACDAARAAEKAFISLRRGYRFVPKHVFSVPTSELFGEDGRPVAWPDWAGELASMDALLDGLVGDLTRLGLQAPDHDAFASHPIMNTRVLDHVAHGDLTPKGDVAGLDGEEIVFAGGSRETVGLVILATGYRHDAPFLRAPRLVMNGGRPALHLNIFPPGVHDLYFIGFVEFAAGAYPHFDRMARLVAEVLASGAGGRDAVRSLHVGYRPDTSGGRSFVSSDRRANYVDAHAYAHAIEGAIERVRTGVPSSSNREAA
ncbi:flavin-containing monooxygenase [Sphingomonas lenta]|uniref:flavin-containing monooxygenase n=1 Tax=Sphingomonas lenta TaxID=1141887 RepID=UPI00114096D2|nr:NAD(P)-binding domain-containing protein [Sphingomonas lenta]